VTFDPSDEATAVVELEAVGSEESEEILVLDEVPDPQATLPVWEPTGNTAVDAALEDLHAVAQSDLAEHAEIYERVQQSLRATLDGLAADDDPA
jgi:hypothetical protein